MLLNFLIYINRRKLNEMIIKNYSYNEILKQSQKLDELINIYMKKFKNFEGEKCHKKFPHFSHISLK